MPSNNRKTSFIQALLLIIVSPLLFFSLLEMGLALFGVNPILQKEDPFVGFAGRVPLFTKKTPNGQVVYTTAKNKLVYFNKQMLPAEKSAGTYRIFMRTDIDYLVVENFIFDKSQQPELFNDGDWRRKYVLD